MGAAGFDTGSGLRFTDLGLAPVSSIFIRLGSAFLTGSSQGVRSTGNPFAAMAQRAWARSSIPELLPQEASRETTVTSRSFRMDFVKPVNTAFGPTSIKVDRKSVV